MLSGYLPVCVLLRRILVLLCGLVNDGSDLIVGVSCDVLLAGCKGLWWCRCWSLFAL